MKREYTSGEREAVTYFVGDEEKDMQAAESAGVKGIKFPNTEFLSLFI